jgi:apolipoprotein N-acyltransferase
MARLSHRIRRLLGPRAAGVVLVAAAAAWWVTLEYVVASLAAWAALICYLSLGTTQWPCPALIQNAAWGGMYAVSVLMALTSAGIALAIIRRSAWPLALPAAALGLSLAGGLWRLSRSEPEPGSRTLRAAVLQANIRPMQVIDERATEHVARSHLSLLPQLRKARPDLVVWSEGAVPWVIEEDDDLVRCMVANLRPLRPIHLVGAISKLPPGPGPTQQVTAYLLLPDGRITGQYNKTRPVLFAETGPRFLGRWVQTRLCTVGAEGLIGAGRSVRALNSPVGLIGVAICNEVVYTDISRKMVLDGAEIMAHMANGVWLAGSWPRPQHFAASVLRAVETGRDTLVANNSGISAIIDARGRVKTISTPHTRVCLWGQVVRRSGRTAYMTGGDWFAGACLAGSLLVFAWAWGWPHLSGASRGRPAMKR